MKNKQDLFELREPTPADFYGNSKKLEDAEWEIKNIKLDLEFAKYIAIFLAVTGLFILAIYLSYHYGFYVGHIYGQYGK